MTEKRDIRRFSKAVKGGDPRMQGYFAIIGKLDGTILTGVGNKIYVTTFEGQVKEVINRRVPNIHGSVVFVGSDPYSANRIEVLYTFNASGNTNGGVAGQINIVPPHSHSYPGGNTTWVYAGQIMPLNVLPIAGTLTVRVYPGVIRKNSVDGWLYIEEQIVDVSGDVPSTTSEALWIVLQANDDGSVDYVVGSAAASRSALDETDIPEPTTGRALFAVILEEGRNELFRNNVTNDFMDLRFDRGGGLASLVDAGDVTYSPLDDTDWDYLADPGDVADALDQLADRAKSLENLIPFDASEITYTPNDLNDWDYLTDPGETEDALDQLAARTTDLETTPPGSWDGDITDLDETSSADIGEALADADQGIVYNDSGGSWVRFAFSRIKTYIQALTDTLYLAIGADYSDISGNDAATDVTGAELETLTDGSDADSLHVHSPALQSFSPSWTNLSVGDGTVVAEYMVDGDVVSGYINLTFGSSTSISGTVRVDLPVQPTVAPITPIGIAICRETGVAQYQAALYYLAPTVTCEIRVLNSSGTYVSQSVLSSTVPFSWASGDELLLEFSYFK